MPGVLSSHVASIKTDSCKYYAGATLRETIMKVKNMVVLTTTVLCCMLMTAQAFAGDNGNGTVTVNGLVWLKNAGCVNMKTWPDAGTAAANLSNGQCGLKDTPHTSAWRLPTKEELRVIYQSKNLFSNVQSAIYWSSSAVPGDTQKAYGFQMGTGFDVPDMKNFSYYVWPVRFDQ